MSEATLRDAAPADLEAITAIYNEAVENSTASWDDVPLTLENRRVWFDGLQRPGATAVVVERGGAVVGYAAYGTFRDKPGYRATVEHSIYLAPEARGQGLGSLLLAELVRRARAEGLHAMVGGLSGDNEASLRLHRAYGFQEVARFPQVGQKFGRWLDLVMLQLLLDQREAPRGPTPA